MVLRSWISTHRSSPEADNNGRPLYTKFGRTATTREFDGRTHSTYHSLQATINRRFEAGCS